jgi:AcrR family transcriptional regulator
MKPRSHLTSGRKLRKDATQGVPRQNGTPPTPRLDSAARRAMILDQAISFFSDYGLTAQTRALADAIGVTQRLLYRYYPSKSDLLRAVYDAAILSPFKALWLVQLTERSVPIRVRLIAFYSDYHKNVLTKRWLRLFLYASLGETEMAPNYIQEIVARLLETIANETAAALAVALPDDPVLARELAWVLHGSISHYAIRQHVYGALSPVDPAEIVRMNVDLFLGGFADAVRKAPAAQGGDEMQLSRQLTT